MPTKAFNYAPSYLERISSPEHEEAPEAKLQADGYQLMPFSEIGATKTFTCVRGEDHMYAVLIQAKETLLVFIATHKNYAAFMQSFASFAHILDEDLLLNFVYRP